MISLLPPEHLLVPARDDDDPAEAGFALGEPALAAGAEARLDALGPVPVAVARLSPTAAWVTLPPGAAPLPAGLSTAVAFRFGAHRAGPVPAEVLETVTRLADGRLQARLRLIAVPLEEARRIAAIIGELARARLLSAPRGRPVLVETLGTRERVASAARALLVHGCEGFARGAAGGACAVRGRWVDEAAELPLVWEVDGPWPEAPLTLTVAGLTSVFEFTVDRAEPRQGLLATSLPERMRRTRRRWWRRVAGAAPLVVAFRHPHWPELHVEGATLDVSREGLGIASTPVRDLLYPGLEIPDVEVVEGAAAGLRLVGEVRHVRLGEGRAAVGLKVAPGDAGDDGRWAEALERRLHPHTRVRGAWSGQLWDLFEDAGYFALSNKSTKHFVDLRRQFGDALRRLERAPDLAGIVTWPSERGLEGSMTAVRAYAGSWFAYHLAQRREPLGEEAPRRTVLREVFLRLYEQAQARADLPWMVIYIQRTAYWPRLAGVEFPKRYVDVGEADVVPFHAMQFACYRPPHPLPGGFEVGDATSAEREALLAWLARERPRCYLESQDLVPARLELAEVRDAWAKAGLQRERVVRVARRDGELFAAAVCERVDDGVHLYGLLDTVRAWPLRAGGEAGFAALLEDARGWFHAHGKKAFIYLREHGEPDDLARLGPVDMGWADNVAFSSRLLPDFVEHVWEITAGRAGR